MQPTFGLDL